MDTYQDDFLISRFRQALHFFPDALQTPGTDWSPCIGNDAVGTLLVTTFLNLQIGAGLVRFVTS